MSVRRFHRIIGIVMLLPFIAWAVTGMVFFIKPGYGGAYEILQPRTYALDKTFSITPGAGWLEYRCLRTVLGEHLLVRTADGWSNRDPQTLAPRNPPSTDEMKLLIEDSTSGNPERYGKVASVVDYSARTVTGIEIRLDWNRLSLQQRGPDTNFLDRLYKIHYLQWTGFAVVDRALGLIGLVLVLTLSLLGLRLAFRRSL